MPNSFIVIGNIGSDPELRWMPSGKPVCNFSLATHAGKDENGERRTTWVDIAVMGDRAEVASKVLRTGQFIECHGYCETRMFEKKDGSSGCNLRMTVFNVKIRPTNTPFVEIDDSNNGDNQLKVDDEIINEDIESIPEPETKAKSK